MNDEELIRRRVQQLRPYAKFVDVFHSRDFIPGEADLGDGFYTASLYDERVDANLIAIRPGRVIIQNTYLSSFAYNLFACWLHGHSGEAAAQRLDSLLAYNFKKFLAEQLYRAKNCIRSRTLLLETLLFEQVVMTDVISARENDVKLSAAATVAADLMSFALLMHELGHYLIATKPITWDLIVQNESSAIGSLYAVVAKEYPRNIITEFQCDVYAVVGCLREYGNQSDYLLTLRTLTFAYAAYAVMYSAAATAKDTASVWETEPEEDVDFLDIAPFQHVEHDVRWTIDKSFMDRARLVEKLCEGLAAEQGLMLFGDDGVLPLPPSIIDDLMRYLGRVFDCDDDNARNMSHLVARSLHGHEVGMEYLYLRSKIFRSERDKPLTL